ncbi:hypothetical protein OXX80_008800 [Metschnikowia pulcherrima]
MAPSNTTPPKILSTDSRKCSPKNAGCYRFEADFESLWDWPSRAVAWLAMMEQQVRMRENIVTEKQKYTLYTSRLGYGPALRLAWAQKLGHVTDFRTFVAWFKDRYIDFIEQNRLVVRYENVRQTASVHQYILDFERVHRANCQLVPLERVVAIFCKNLRNRGMAQQIEARFSTDMDLEDVMIMAKFCAGERHNDRPCPDTTPMRDYICMPETPN